MTLTLEQVAGTVAKLHHVAENAVTRNARATGTLALVLPGAVVGAVLPFGPSGDPPSDEYVVAQAAARGVVGLALTGEYWTDLASLTRQQAALGSRDLPRPSRVRGIRRGEQIITTVVVLHDGRALRYCTPIQRTAFGTSLGERIETYDDPVMPDGEARRLTALLERARATR